MENISYTLIMEKRENDIFMSMLANPQASFDNIVTVGLTAENTSLQDKDAYLNNRFVQEQFKTHDDKFDRAAFDKAYDIAKLYYNNLADADFEKAMENQLSYHHDNINNIEKERPDTPLFKEIKIANPYEQNFSISRLGRVDEPNQSEAELAQKNKVLANPTTAGTNLENAIWEDSPNDSFFGHFLDTLVMAQYDEDGEHVDPISGETVKHYKGQLKTNNEGQFYYEKLDGRDIYGRRVLNKMDVLTTDGSALNKYDFFDSDGLQQKSVGASILKNTALVGSMFIPYVGPWIAGLSAATQLAGLGATFGKMLVGSDSPTLSSIEGWAKSMNRQTAKSQYAQEHTWCWENFIDLVGDVAGQLKEQRFFFEKVPALVKGVDISSEAKYMKKLEQWQKLYKDQAEATYRSLSKKGLSGTKLASTKSDLMANAAVKAQAKMDSFIKGYNNLGRILSMGYMTGITTADTYGEAKQAGASDLDATLLTLGYSAAEFALLNSDIGKWILPELRADRYKNKAIREALVRHSDETKSLYEQFGSALGSMPKEGKKAYVKKLFNIGKNIARAEYANGTKTLQATLAAGLAEGTEEVSEEILADFSKGCYNVVNWLRGSNIRMNSFGYDTATGTWEGSDILDRYGMSLIGGAVGGSLTNAFTSYRQFRNLGNMTSKQAVQELVYMGRNGQLEQFEKELDKSIIADKNKSATDFTQEEDQLIFAPGTKENNQDLYAKKAIKETIRMIDHLLKAEGASLSDESFLDKQTLGDLRFHALHNSAMAGAYLNEFNTLSADLVKMQSQLAGLRQSTIDNNQDGTVTDREQRTTPVSETNQSLIKELETKIQDTKTRLTDLVNGKHSYEFVGDALFEMTTDLSKNLVPTSFPLYAENETGRKYAELTENEKAALYEKYKTWKSGDGRDQIREMASIFRTVLQQASNTIKNQGLAFDSKPQNMEELEKAVSYLYQGLNIEDESMWLTDAQERQTSSLVALMQTLVDKFGSEQDVAKIETLKNRMSAIDKSKKGGAGLYAINANKLYKKYYNLLLNNIGSYLQPVIQGGFANTETKEQLDRVLEHLYQVAMKNYVALEQSPTATDADLDSAMDTIVKINRTRKEVAALDNTPFEKNLDEFSISIGNNPINISQLLVKLNTLFRSVSGDVSRFNMDEALYKDLTNAINTVEMYKAAIKAMSRNNANAGNYYGYTTTLNEINKKMMLGHPELTELDESVANKMLADLNVNLNKLYFLKRLYQLNQGQKLSRQDRVSANKDRLIYKRMRSIVSVPDNDPIRGWNGFLELQNAVNSMEIHEKYSKRDSLVVDDVDKVTFEKEKIALEDAVYEFFQKNQDKLDDPQKLMEFVNTRRFQLYTEANKLLNEELADIDDNSMLWWIASRAAVKSSSFYSSYKEILDPSSDKPLAPVATQEMAVYLAYAGIMNGDVFTKFYTAARQAIISDWKQKSMDDRRAMLKLLNKQEALADESLADFAINFLPVPRYMNTILIEGIAGSGKTSAVVRQVVAMLKGTNSDILKKAAIVHGAALKSANKTRDDVNLIEAATYDKEAFMRMISPSWKKYRVNPDTHKQEIPESDFRFTDENELRSALKTGSSSSLPKLIIIDEISKFSSYDMDLIDQVARETGSTVLVLGDFDQSGVAGRHTVTINNQRFDWTVSLEHTNFMSTLKLGVPMRTDNSLKTGNQQKTQAYIHERSDQPLELDWFADDTGLYGDRVLGYSDDGQPGDKAVVISDLKEQLDRIIRTLKPGEKIGYIYTDVSSPIYKFLHSEGYEQYIDDKQGDSALGLEGRYYIVEASPGESLTDPSLDVRNEAVSTYLHDIYTGMTRSQQGSIIIAPVNVGPEITSVRQTEKTDDHTNNQIIAQYTNRRKKLLDEAVQQGSKVEYIPRKGAVETKTEPDSKKKEGGLSSGTVAVPPQPVPQKPAPIRVEPENPKTESGQSYNIVSLSECPRDIREELINIQNWALQNPDTSEGFDSDDSLTDLKYGQIVQVGAPGDQEYGVIYGVKSHENGIHNYLIKVMPYGSRVITSDYITAVVETNTSHNTVLSHDSIKNRIGDKADISDITVEIDGRPVTLPLCQIPFVNKQGDSGYSNIVAFNYKNDLVAGVVVVNFNGVHIPFRLHGSEWLPFFGIAGTTINGVSSINGVLLDISNQLLEKFGNDVSFLDETVTNDLGQKELPQVDFINQDMDPVDESDPMFSELLHSNISDFYNKLDEAVKNLVPEDVPVPVEETGYENQPVTDTDVINEREYKDQLDTENDEENVPEPVLTDTSGQRKSLQMLLHSHNTFELGVLSDKNGMPVVNSENPAFDQDGKNWGVKRIDSVNGLMKIDQLLGHPIRSVREYEIIIGKLRDIMFKTGDKALLNKYLGQILGLQEINTIFALRNTPYMSESTRASGKLFVENSPSVFSKGVNETTRYNGSSDERSSDWHNRTIVGVITVNNKAVLELPLLALSSPFTLLHEYGLGDKLESLLREGRNLHEIAVQFEEELKDVHPELSDLFSLFNMTDRAITFIRDDKWTIAGNMESLGPQFFKERGKLQSRPGYNYDLNADPEREWGTVESFMNNPQVYVTPVLGATRDISSNTGNTAVRAGHSFVLVSYDLALNTPKAVMDYYQEQLNDPTKVKKVQRVYILPPKASAQEYVENLHKIFTRTPGVQPIGCLQTSYKIVKALIQNEEFRNVMEERFPGLINTVEKAIEGLETAVDNKSKYDKLFAYHNWSNVGMPNKSLTLAQLFDNIIMSFVYSRNILNGYVGQQNQFVLERENLQLFNDILEAAGLNIFYNVKYDKSWTQEGDFMVGPEHKYNIDGKPFMMPMKIDSPMFRADMDWLVQQFLHSLWTNKAGHKQNKDSLTYNNGGDIIIGQQNLSENKQVEYIKKKTGLDLSALYQDKTKDEGDKAAVRHINETVPNQIAFIVNGEILISNINENLGRNTLIYDDQMNPVDDLSNLSDNNGTYHFNIVSDGVTYKAEYKNGQITMFSTEENPVSGDLTITENNFSDFMDKAKQFLIDRLNLNQLYVGIHQLLGSENYDNFIANLNELEETELSRLIGRITSEQDTDQILDQLIQSKRALEESEQDNHCPLNISIKV